MKKSLMLLSGLVAANVAPIQSTTAAERPAFSVQAEFFEAKAGDRVITESTDKGTGVRWEIRYPDRETRVLTKSIANGLLKDAAATSFWIRGNGRHQLGLQMVDDDGTGFSKIFNVEPHWTHLRFPFSELSSNCESENPFDPARVRQAVLFDYSAALKPQKHGRTIWLADWRFAVDSVTPS